MATKKVSTTGRTVGVPLNPSELDQLEFIRKMLRERSRLRSVSVADALRYAITATFENES